MTDFSRTSKYRGGFSLGEMLVALVIGAMVLTAVLTIYSRADRSAAAILNKLDSSTEADEVLQLIAEDLDRAVFSGSDAVITIENKLESGFAKARLVIRRTIHDGKDEEKTFEEIVWQAAYDYESAMPGLVLYRSYDGIGVEDKLLDEQRQDLERSYPFVPVCGGMTFFRIEVPNGDDFLDKWSSPSLPVGVKVTISFAESFQTVSGTLEVPDEQKVSRTIAVDRTRKITFEMPSPTTEEQKTNGQTPSKLQ